MRAINIKINDINSDFEVTPRRVREDQVIILEDKIPEATKTLNEKQLYTFYEILDFLKSSNNYYVLEGYAGTGKTYLLSRVISVIGNLIAMTAPTNKAVKVLAEHKIEGVEYSTIHKLLALRLEWVYPPKGSGKEAYQKLVRKRNTPTTVNDYDVLIIDEASMLDDELFMMVHTEKKSEHKIIFMGDPAQIPPVNKLDSFPLLQEKRVEFSMNHQTLEKIMRQKDGNTILEISDQIRNRRFGKEDPILTRLSSKDVHFYSSISKKDQDEFTRAMLSCFNSKYFKEDANFCKVIAWTNKVVNSLNRLIRSSIYKGQELKQLMLGEKLIADSPIIDEHGSVRFNTSDEFSVISLEEDIFHYRVPDETESFGIQMEADFVKDLEVKGVKENVYYLKYYRCLVEVFDPVSQEKYTDSIDVLMEESQAPFTWALGKLKRQENWRARTKLLERFAQVKYNYAITAHKSQGSTYGVVFLMEDDIDQNKRSLERNRIKYTACTRPKYQLHILGKRNTYRENQRNHIAPENYKRIFGK